MYNLIGLNNIFSENAYLKEVCNATLWALQTDCPALVLSSCGTLSEVTVSARAHCL